MTTRKEQGVLSKEEWLAIKQAAFEGAYGEAKLIIDGFTVTLQRQVSGNKLTTVLYVNEELKGEWSDKKEGQWCEEVRRFYQVRSKSLHTRKEQRKAVRVLGKKASEGLGIFSKFEYLWPYWNSFNSFKRHLLKNNKHFEIERLF